MKALIIILFVILLPLSASAQLVITEIMYDPKEADAASGGEWIEVQNVGQSEVDLTKWILFEADVNHGISADGLSGLVAGQRAVISRDLVAFKNYFSSYSGLLFKASFSLNDGELLGLKENREASLSDSVNYSSSSGAKNDGNSLQKVGTSWVAASPTPGTANSEGAGTATLSPASAENPSVQVTESVYSVEPQIHASIKAPASGISGADIIFSGRVTGLKGEPIDNANYYWNFGDGFTNRGQSVVHTFFFPGDYEIFLEASSGTYTAIVRQSLKIVPAELYITEVKSGPDGYISILNKASVELDISFWSLESAGKYFEIPRNTLIGPSKKIVFANKATGLSGSDASLLYPNRAVAVTYVPKVIPEPKQVQIVKPSETKVESPKPATVAALAITDATSTAAMATSKKTNEGFDSKWLLLVAIVCALGVIGYFSGKQKTEDDEAASYKIVDVSQKDNGGKS